MGEDGIINVSKDYLKKNPNTALSFSAGSVSAKITSTGVTLSASLYGVSYEGANTNADKMKDSGFTVADNINKYYVRSGISAGTGTANVRVRPLDFNKQSSDATFDLSAYQSTEPDQLEKFIDALVGKAIKDISYGFGSGWFYEFIDSASSELFDRRTYYTQLVDNSWTTVHRVTKNYNDGDETAGVSSITLASRSITNADTTMTAVEGVLRHYDIDFNKWFDSEDDKALVDYNLMGEYIDGKGFRAFCATDDTE